MRITCMLCCIRAFAANKPSRGTSSGSVMLCAGAKKLEQQLTAQQIAQICGTVTACVSSRIKIPRATSLAIIVRRGSQRSANAPPAAPGPRRELATR